VAHRNRQILFAALVAWSPWLWSCSGGSGTTPGIATTPPVFVTEAHSATDGVGADFNTSTLSLNVTGPNPLLLVAWHSEYDNGLPNSWNVTCNGAPGTEIIDTNGYNGGDGNRRFRIYYWLSPAPGKSTIVVSNPGKGPNELAVSALLFNHVSVTDPRPLPVLDVSTSGRTGESETIPTVTSDLVVHVIANALFTRGMLGNGETSRSIANDDKHTDDGDASLWISTKPASPSTTSVSSSGWTSHVINGVAITLHGAS
jgi:hypothetical protein